MKRKIEGLASIACGLLLWAVFGLLVLSCHLWWQDEWTSEVYTSAKFGPMLFFGITGIILIVGSLGLVAFGVIRFFDVKVD
ncbi:hypothetical protein [Anaerohalosphaera lusitana]|nr:hypothetical protein [Anaerohalosphaera lusitana]